MGSLHGRSELLIGVCLFCFVSGCVVAATAILYAKEDPSVAGMVLDSPFSDLPLLCEEVASTAQVRNFDDYIFEIHLLFYGIG